jgi:glycosyltransferase involved in cell wall biosynthesis
MIPVFSVVIPGFNRPEPLKYTLRSAADAIRTLGSSAELLVIDDGSTPPLVEQMQGFDPGVEIRWVRQKNQGSIAARLTGLHAATGEFVLFLDSDDLVHPDKLRAHAASLRTMPADISYDDMARATLGPDYSAQYVPADSLGRSTEVADWALRVQPPPHSPIYRREYLRAALAQPCVPVQAQLDAAGDIWLYYNLSIHPARITKIDAALTAIGPHEETRYSSHWEKLGLAALRVMREFAARCPRTPGTLRARTIAGEIAFHSWRRLPRNFNAGFERATFALWRNAPRGPLQRLGEARFVTLSRLIGPSAAARLLRRLRGKSYASCRTLSDEEYQRLFETVQFL